MSNALWRACARKRRKMRRRLLERDGSKCFHCGKPTRLPGPTDEPNDMTVDHWPVPKSQLRIDEWYDLSRAVLSCRQCNDEHNRAMQKRA